MSKKSIILHIDSLDVLDELTELQAGALFKLIKAYKKGENYDTDVVIKMAFIPFKNQFKRDEIEYNKVVERNRLNGLQPRKAKKASRSQLLPVATDSDSDSKNKSDKKNDKKKILKKMFFYQSVYFGNCELLKTEIGDYYNQKYDIEFYYQQLKNWGEKNERKDWLAVCRTFIANDEKSNTAKLKIITQENKPQLKNSDIQW